VIGIDPDQEDKITALRQKVVEGRYLTSDDTGVLLAEGLASRLNLRLHDTLVVIGQGYHGAIAAGKYSINGIVKFGLAELNNQSLYLSLRSAQELYSADGLITSLVLALDNPNKMDATAKAVQSSIGNHYETMTWEEMMPDVEQHIRTDNGSMYIIQGILYMLICFGIFGTLVVMMAERKYEMGMLVALGMKKIKLMQLLLMESVFTVLSGCTLGILTSIPLVFYLYKYPIRFTGELGDVYVKFGFEPIFPASMDADVFITQGLIVLALGMILSIYPLLKVIRLNPVTAMKK
jgi:ABC-type lipoprotein release transport system permease subunit